MITERFPRACGPTLALLTCFVLLAPHATAQGLLLRGGLNFSRAALDPEPAAPVSVEMRRGYNAALLGELGGGPIRLTTGAGYEQRGLRLGGGGGKIELDYVSIPVMITMGPPAIDANAAVFLSIGVEPAFLIASAAPAGNAAVADDDLRDFDITGRAELGIELPLSYSGPSLLVGGAYTLGFTDVNRGPNGWHNHAFHIFAGLKLRWL